MNKLFSFTLGAVLCASTSAFAGGYQLAEYSAVSLGRSFGGAGVVGDDFSAIALNPAGMTLKQSGVQAGVNVVMIKARTEGTYNGAGGTPGKIDVGAGIPHLFTQYAQGDWRFGLGVYVPFGLSAKYKSDDWFGSDVSVNSKITVVDVAPTVAYEINDTVSVGLSLLLENCSARMTNTVRKTTWNGGSSMNADDDVEFGYVAGIMVKPTQDLKLGISYRAKTEHKIDGPHFLDYGAGNGLLSGPKSGTVGTTLDFPEHVLLSGSYNINDKWTVGAMAKWTRWTRFNVLRLNSNITNVAPVDEKWKNVWDLGIGADYHYSPEWTFRFGAGYDQAGVPDAAHRTARVPDSDRIKVSGGFSWTQEKYQIDFGYMHLFFRRSRAEHGGMNADYQMSTDVFSIQGQYFF